MLSNLPALFALLTILLSRLSAVQQHLVDWTSGGGCFFLFLLLLLTACLVLGAGGIFLPTLWLVAYKWLPFIMGGHQDCNTVPGGLPFVMGGRPDCHKVPGGLPFSMGGRPVCRLVQKFGKWGVPFAWVLHVIENAIAWWVWFLWYSFGKYVQWSKSVCLVGSLAQGWGVIYPLTSFGPSLLV